MSTEKLFPKPPYSSCSDQASQAGFANVPNLLLNVTTSCKSSKQLHVGLSVMESKCPEWQEHPQVHRSPFYHQFCSTGVPELPSSAFKKKKKTFAKGAASYWALICAEKAGVSVLFPPQSLRALDKDYGLKLSQVGFLWDSSSGRCGFLT